MNTDDRLLFAARRMDKRALAEIFDMYAHQLYLYAFRYCNDSILADQIVGDVFAKFLEKLAVGKGPENNLRSYLFETTFHSIVDEVRYAARRAPIDLIDIRGGNLFSSELNIDDPLELEKIEQALRCLTPDQRHVIVLRFLEGCSLAETASILGKSVSCVKITQFRAIWNLRTKLKDEQKVECMAILN